ncbi:MAG: hypothetical protein ACOZHQ_00845 [Thermodesulfobacteriota bacterium]
MQARISGAIITLALLLATVGLATAQALKPGDQLTLSQKTTLMSSLRGQGASSSADKHPELKPGVAVKVLGSSYGLGKPWYEVETSEGRGWISAVVLERQAPPREWLEKLGKPVVLKKGQRLSLSVDSLDNNILTVQGDISTTVLEVASLQVGANKRVTRVRVEAPLSEGDRKVKGWVQAQELGQ